MEPGDTHVFLQTEVNWEVGQEILLVTSTFFDCPPEYEKKWCKGRRHENEVRKIVAISDDRKAVQIDAAEFQHFASPEYQSEVALLTRRIVLEGTKTNDGFGMHTLVKGEKGTFRVRGTQVINGGQKNILARYPLHFHLMENQPDRAYFQDNSVVNSNFRCYTVHGTSQALIARNVAYNAYGNCFFLEDGVEEDNRFLYNLAAHVHPIREPVRGGFHGERKVPGPELLIPTDTAASGFYITNAKNVFIGNAASGGWNGFYFPNIPFPLGHFDGTTDIEPWK